MTNWHGVTEAAIREGLRKAVWDGRLEIVSSRPLLVLDGAHNPASVKRLADAIGTAFSGRYDRLFIVMGVLSDKDSGFMLEALASFAYELVLTQAEYERAVPAGELLKKASELGVRAVSKGKVSDAVEYALAGAGPGDMVLVTGSLYVVGEARAWAFKRELFLRA